MSSTTVPGITSPTKPSPTANLKPSRLPAPTLFVGPPSRNASQLSVARPPINREKSARSRIYNTDNDGEATNTGPNTREVTPVTLRKASEKSVDAKWREMQSTLNEVELTAQSSTHVFGEAHAKALDELRDAQIALARAWGRGNEVAQAAASNASDSGTVNVNRFQSAEAMALERRDAGAGSMLRGNTTRARAETAGSASTVLSDESFASSQGSIAGSGGRSTLEDETAQDIRLASERRAANEEYFMKVDQGVKEVVEKLERVAEAMRGVEGESRSLWGGSSVSSGVDGAGEGKKAVGEGVGTSATAAGG